MLLQEPLRPVDLPIDICTDDQMLFSADRCDLDEITSPEVGFMSERILFGKLLCKNQTLLCSKGEMRF